MLGATLDSSSAVFSRTVFFVNVAKLMWPNFAKKLRPNQQSIQVGLINSHLRLSVCFRFAYGPEAQSGHQWN
jgi:hypothetical protein